MTKLARGASFQVIFWNNPDLTMRRKISKQDAKGGQSCCITIFLGVSFQPGVDQISYMICGGGKFGESS